MSTDKKLPGTDVPDGQSAATRKPADIGLAETQPILPSVHTDGDAPEPTVVLPAIGAQVSREAEAALLSPDLPFAPTAVAAYLGGVRTGVDLRVAGQIAVGPSLTGADTPDAPEVVDLSPDDLLPDVFALSFSHIHTQAAFIRLGLSIPEKSMEIPRARHATYLMLDRATVDDPKHKRFIADEIGIIANCRDFAVTEDSCGNLTIVAFAERGGVEKLFDIEKSLRDGIPQAKMMMGDCTIRKTGNKEFTLFDSNLETDAAKILDLELADRGATMLTTALAAKIADPHSRVGSNIDLHQRSSADPKYVRLLEAISLVSKEQGGPDRLIGYQAEFAALERFAIDDETGIISLEGAGGMGKSRLRTELLKRLPSSVLCSLNASDRNILGSSLVTLAEQLTKTIEEDEFFKGLPTEKAVVPRMVYEGDVVMTGEATTDEQAITLVEFKDWSHADRIKFTAKHPETVMDLCYNALSQLRAGRNPQALFVLEDLHHADRISEPFLASLVKKYTQAEDGRPVGKSLVTARPEEIYQSSAFKDLKAKPAGYGAASSVKVISLKGLDFSSVGHDFAYYCLPPELRKDREIGDWHRTLARKSGRSPWVMKSFMDQVKTRDETSGAYPNIVITGRNVIELSKDFRAGLAKIDPDSDADLATYFHERLATLNEKSRKLLQCIALMEERLTPWYVLRIAREILGMDDEELKKTVSLLSNAGYITEDRVRGDFCKLQHEATRDIVLSSIPDDETRLQLARELYALFKNDEGLFIKTKRTLADVIAGSMADDDEGFWQEYAGLTAELLADAEYHCDAEYGYESATKTVGLPAINMTAEALARGERVSAVMEELAVSCLMAKADHARALGKFDETDEAVAVLKTIHELRPIVVDILRVHLIAFEAACMKDNKPEIAAVYKEIHSCGVAIPKNVGLILDIRLATFQRRYNDAVTLYNANEDSLHEDAVAYAKEHSAPSPVHLDLRRLCECRCPYEQLRRKESQIEGRDYDDDVLFRKPAFGPEGITKLERILGILKDIEKTRKLHPVGLDPWSEIKIINQEAEISACLERYDEALKLFAETWRICMQLSLFDPAVGAIKAKGDTEVMQALNLAGDESEEARAAKVKLIKKAISTYTVEGFNEALTHVSEQSAYQFILRAERIRAVGILALELKEQLHSPDETRAEFEPYFTLAMDDFKYLNKNLHWSKVATDLKHPYHPIMPFYVMGYIGHILHVADACEIDVDSYLERGEDSYNERQYPYMNLALVEQGIGLGDNMTDLGFGEVQRKIEGLHILAKALRRREHHLGKRKRVERDEALRSSRDRVVVPRASVVLRQIGFGTSEAIVDTAPEYSESFLRGVGALRMLTMEILDIIPGIEGGFDDKKPQLKQAVSDAITTFKQLNSENPQFADSPEALYQIMGYMGHVIAAAYRFELTIDGDILNEQVCSFMKMDAIKKAYKFGEEITDLGAGEVAEKMNGLFTLLTILGNNEARKSARDRREKDAAALKKRMGS